MRVAIVTESFLPQVNGVTNSVLRVCEHLRDSGHEALVVAPGSGPDEYAGARVVRGRSFPLPGYPDFAVGLPWPKLTALLREFSPDVIHLAAPTLLGAQGAVAARILDIPSVAIFQTDLAGFATKYRMGGLSRPTWRWLCGVHSLAARTLAPSRHAVEQLEKRGVDRVRRWARGVDQRRFHPGHRDATWRARLAPAGEVIVGYIGRLAAEKDVHLLSALDGLSGVKLVVTGDGPQRAALERKLPHATFLGHRTGHELSQLHASADVFVHTGAHETFCQAAQEALASGVPIVVPAAGGLLDLVTPGETGFGFRPGSAHELRDHVRTLAEDPALRMRMGRAARLSVADRSWQAIGDELLTHYREVAA